MLSVHVLLLFRLFPVNVFLCVNFYAFTHVFSPKEIPKMDFKWLSLRVMCDSVIINEEYDVQRDDYW